VSADGRYVVFESSATNLVAGDTNGVADVFVRDAQSNTTSRVSVATGGTQATGGASTNAAVSADGRYVVFESSATNLVAGDTNGVADVFVRDTQSNTTSRVSVATGGVQATGGASTNAAVSADGRYVVFESSATNLVSGDTNGVADVFVRDTQSNTTSRVSVATGGAQATGGASTNAAVSGNGRYVAFQSAATNLVAGDTNAATDVFVRDLTGAQTSRASVSSAGAQATGTSLNASISNDGRRVAFESTAANLIAGDTNIVRDVFVRDRTGGLTSRVSEGSFRAQGNGPSSNPSISSDGKYVALESTATNLVDGDKNGQRDIVIVHTTIPTVTSVTPAVLRPGTSIPVTITGSNFPTGAGILIGGDGVSASAITVNSESQIQATLTAGSSVPTGLRDVAVTDPGTIGLNTGSVGSCPACLFVGPAPTITSISPTQGPTTGGVTIGVNGAAFTNATQVKFGTVNATSFTVTNDGSLTAVAPALAAGTYDIRITTPGGTSAVIAADRYATVADTNHCGTITGNVTWNAGPTHILSCTTTIPPGSTLTLGPGTIVKGGPGSQLVVNGSLVVSGTSASPVVFTSIKDDSTAGDTNGDGNASSPAAGDWGGITVPGAGSADMSYPQIRYASQGLAAVTSGSVRVVNGQLSHLWSGGLSINAPGVVVQNTSVANGWDASGGPGPAFVVNSQALNLDNVTGNSATGTGLRGFYVEGSATTSTWHAQPVPWIVGNCGTGPGLVIPQGATVTVAAGAVIKGLDHTMNCSGSTSPAISANGSLVVSGTSASPVVFTSIKDDSTAGDTNGDGNASSPAAGDWGGITVPGAGSAIMNGTSLKYGSTCLSVSDGSNGVAVHGSVATCGVGVAGGNDYLDATNVDWGSSSGPSPVGTGVPYSGAGVEVLPWVGYVPPARPVTAPPQAPPAPGDPDYNCTSYAVLGLRGSGEEPQPASDGSYPSTDPNAFAGARVYNIYYGFQQALHQADSTKSVKITGIKYRALGVLYNPINLGTDAYWNSIYDGVDKLIAQMRYEHGHCPSEKLILAGYSQGALVIHIALRTLQGDSLLNTSVLSGVALLADPAKVGNASESYWERSDGYLGSGVKNANGIYDKVFSSFGLTGPLPSSVTGRTLGLCHNHDIVCAPPNIVANVIYDVASVIVHTDSYTATDENLMGSWLSSHRT
jgi:hypothetical protein